MTGETGRANSLFFINVWHNYHIGTHFVGRLPGALARMRVIGMKKTGASSALNGMFATIVGMVLGTTRGTTPIVARGSGGVTIEDFGTGCARYDALERVASSAADTLGLSCELDRERDFQDLAQRDVMFTPAPRVNRRVTAADRAPPEAEVARMRTTAL